MNCPKCNGVLEQNSKFCHYCGTQLQQSTMTQPTMTQPTMTQPTITQNYQQPSINNQQPQQPPSPFDSINRMSEEEELMRAYIGKNNDKLLCNGTRRFNVCALFFDEAYFLYRKMWGWFFIRMGISFVAAFILSLVMDDVSWLSTALSLFFAVIFNNIYTDTVRKRVEKIRQQNPDKTREELVEICRKKGGTSILAVAIYIGGIVLFAVIAIVGFILIFSSSINDLNTPVEIEPIEEKIIKIGDISFTEYEYLTAEISTNDQYKTSYTDGTSSDCTISVKINEDPMCHTTNTCFEQLRGNWIRGEVQPITINGHQWYQRNSTEMNISSTELQRLNKEELYTEINGKVYNVTYDRHGTLPRCSSGYEKLKNTLKINN